MDEVIEEMRQCARAAVALDTAASLAVAERLLMKMWEMEQRAAEPAAATCDTSLKEWAAAERARR
jgi:hypothetical protein